MTDNSLPCSSGPLAHLRVLDLTRVRAGPAATRQFADWGADVVIVEPIADLNDIVGTRHGSDFQNLNRNKRSISIDLRTEEGRDIFLDLVREADLLFENFRPNVKHKLRIDFETLHAINPRLIYVSISGFGQSGPYHERPGLDQVAQGMSGLMSITGFGDVPVRSGMAVSDIGTGLFAAMGAMTALLERDKTGIGRWVQTSLLQSTIAMLDFQAARWLNEGEVPQAVGNDHPTAVPMGLFPTADGFVNIAASGTSLFQRFCTAAQCPALLEDPRFQSASRKANRQALTDEIAAITRQHSSTYWVDLLNRAGVPCGPVYTMPQVFDDPQVRHLGMAQPVEHDALGTLQMVAQPIILEGANSRPVSAAPDPGQNTDAILAQAGFGAERIAALRDAKVIG